jgi:hypothetical protein
MIDERWLVEPVDIDIDENGTGTLAYRILAAGYELHFVVRSFPSTGFDRVGRVADMEYDFLGSLMDGPVDPARDVQELAELSSRVWLGRTDNRSLGWTAANRSNRFFDHAVERTAEGEQPDVGFLASGGGYLVRNAGWLGNGRFGSRSWLSHPHDHPLSQPYHCDIFALYLWRQVSFDVVEAMARKRGAERSTRVAPTLKRLLGIGNSSGVGMVAALVRWPNWMSAYNFPRELALAMVKCRCGPPDPNRVDRFLELMDRAATYYDEQPECPVPEIEPPSRVATGLRRVAEACRAGLFSKDRSGCERPWFAIADIAATEGSAEVREQVNAILLDVFPDSSNAAADLFPIAMKVMRDIDPTVTVRATREVTANRYRWALSIDRTTPEATRYFWYRSEDIGENRRGERSIDPGVENETFVDVCGAIQDLYESLASHPDDMQVGRYLVEAPHHAHAVSRVQLAARLPYSEIRGNIIDAGFLPMDGIRFLLSMMGLECSHPYNQQWVRGVFLQGAPSTEDIAEGRGRDWAFPSAFRLVQEGVNLGNSV